MRQSGWDEAVKAGETRLVRQSGLVRQLRLVRQLGRVRQLRLVRQSGQPVILNNL